MVFKTKNFFLKNIFLSLIMILTINVVVSTSPTHPLSDITPMDVPLQLDGQPIQSGDSDEIVLNETDTFVIDSDIWMGGEIQNYFGFCDGGEAIMHIYDDGSFECIDILGGEISDAYVNRSGDSMYGDLTIVDSADIIMEDDSDISMVTGMVSGLRGPDDNRDATNKIYVDNLIEDSTQNLEDVLMVGNEAEGQNIDMGGGIIENIGDTSTDFTGSGGLNLADGLTILGGGLDVSGNVNFDAGVIDNNELANSDITLNTGTGIVGGDIISLGGSNEISLDTSWTDNRYVEVGGDVMEGHLDFDESFKVTGLESPVDGRDAVHLDYLESQIVDEMQDLESVLFEGHEAYSDIDMTGRDILDIGDLETSGDMGITGGNVGIGTTSPDADLEVDGDIMINNGQGTGTDSIKGSRDLYAGDETYVSSGYSKELTMVFNSNYGKNPSFVNILAGGDGTIEIYVDGSLENTMNLNEGVSEISIDTRGWGDGTYDVTVEVTDGYNDLIEFYYIG